MRPRTHISPMGPISPIRGATLRIVSTYPGPTIEDRPIEDEDDDEYQDDNRKQSDR